MFCAERGAWRDQHEIEMGPLHLETVMEDEEDDIVNTRESSWKATNNGQLHLQKQRNENLLSTGTGVCGVLYARSVRSGFASLSLYPVVLDDDHSTTTNNSLLDAHGSEEKDVNNTNPLFYAASGDSIKLPKQQDPHDGDEEDETGAEVDILRVRIQFGPPPPPRPLPQNVTDPS